MEENRVRVCARFTEVKKTWIWLKEEEHIKIQALGIDLFDAD